ncbi:NAD-dependent epimerase/dehydratase family protein [Microbacterium sp. LWH11-1.2]|uniref:NAD-dependent epimerase/dehydratase family protein n=1 Tax=Microbacterium sp. LWH11-1.2 TaxID=3135258 RepID=UPI0031389AC2
MTTTTSASPSDEQELEELLSRPDDSVRTALAGVDGDLVVLGAGGKVGPTLAMMAARALDSIGSSARVIGVSQWSDPAVRERLENAGVTTVRADLADPDVYQTLPDAAAVAFLVGNKFGSATDTSKTWWMNAAVPALAASRYRSVPSLVYSTGNVYPLRPTSTGGARESDPVGPVGLYAQSCLAREEMYRRAAATWATPVTLFRLNYAAELRYGVLSDIAGKVLAGEPVDVTMPAFNVIWQGDANRWALSSFAIASADVTVLNAAGPETLSVRAVASDIAQLAGRELEITGVEASDALLSDARYCHRLFGYPTVTAQQLLEWTVEWQQSGGRSLGKPTKFEQRTGRF